MKIIHQNIQSLSAKIDQLRLLVRETKSGIHLLTLSETWVKRDASDGEFEIPGYKLFKRIEMARMEELRCLLVKI